MPEYELAAGAVFWIESGSTDHLHILVDGPTPAGKVLLANFSTVRGSGPPDETIVWKKNKRRPFLGQFDYYLFYAMAQIIDCHKVQEKIQRREKNGKRTLLRWMKDHDLEAIRRGFYVSRFVRPPIKAALNQFPNTCCFAPEDQE